MTLYNPYSFSFSGFVFGGADSPYQILSVDGLEGLPSLRVQDDNRGYQDGMFSGRDFYGGRIISIIFNTFGSFGKSAQQNFNEIQSKLLPQQSGTTPLYFLLPPFSEQFINARVRALRTVIDPEYTYGYIKSQVDFYCPIPLYFNSDLKTASLSVSAAPGRTYNRIYNLIYGFGSLTTSTSILNEGWADAYPTITLTGPIANAIVGNVTTNQYLYFSGTLANTDTLLINLQDKLVTLNGNSARNLLTGNSEWFDAPPGTSQYYLTGSLSVPGTTTCTVSWYDTYV